MDNETKDKFSQKTLYAERYVLSKAVNDMDYYYSLTSKLDPKDFLDTRNFILFGVLKSLHEEKDLKSFDYHKVENELQANSAFDIVTQDYLYLIYHHQDSDSGNFDKYLEEILENSTKYKLYSKLRNTADNIVDSLTGKAMDSANFIGKVQTSILDLSTQSKSIAEPVNVADGILEYLEEKRKDYVDMSGLSTGYPILDKRIDGLVPGTLMVVAARKKMGKSTFLTNIAAHMAFIDDRPVLYIDTEMTYPEWRDRLIAGVTGIPERTIKHGGYNDETYDKLMKSVERVILGKKLYHEYMPGYSIDKLSALYKKYKIKEDIQVGFFDYIKEPDSTSVDRQRKEYQILGDVTTRLKDLAGDLNIPFITAIQLNRQGDIADSDRVARYGDVVSYWLNQDKEEIDERGGGGGTYKLVIKDSRRGGTTDSKGIAYYFFGERLSIKEVPADRQPTDFTKSKTYNEYDGANYEDQELR